MKQFKITIGSVKRICDDYANKHKLKIQFNSSECAPGQGASAGNFIWLGKFKNPRRMALVFSHEAGHCLMEHELKRKHKKSPYCIYEWEFSAWQKAFDVFYEVFGMKFNKYDADFISECLSTYRKNNTTSNFYKNL